MLKTGDHIQFVLPFSVKGSKWDNNELRFMLRGLSENQPSFSLTIIGDGIPDWVTGVSFIHQDRYYPDGLEKYWGIKKYENWFDTIHKLDIASLMYNDFVWIYDDNILLRQYYYPTIALKYVEDISDIGHKKWHNTIKAALVEGKGYIYETHIPRKFNGDKLQKMFIEHPYKGLKIPYAPTTLYYNLYCKEPDMDLSQGNYIKASFFGREIYTGEFPSDTDEEVERAVKGKVWVNWNDKGLTTPLKNWLIKRFPNRCKYEK